MVGIQQVFIPAVLVGLAAAAPLAPQPDIAVRDVNELAGLDLAARGLVLDLDERDFEDFDLLVRALYGDEMDLEPRANLFSAVKAVAPALKNIKNVLPGSKKLVGAVSGAVKAKNAVVGAAKTVGKTVVNNKGKTYDRLLKTADTSMNIAKTAKGKRDIEWDLEERDEWDLEERDEWDLKERDEWDLEERDEWDLEERANIFKAVKAVAPALKNIKNVLPGSKKLVGAVSGAVKAKNAVTGAAKTVAKTVVNNKGKTYDRLLKTADTSMNVAKTVKTNQKPAQGKRDEEDLEERDEWDLEERDDESDLEERANILNAVKAVAPALKNIKNVLPGSRKLVGAVSGAVKAKNAVTGAAKTVAKTVVNNKGKTYDRLLKTADTSMKIAQTAHKRGAEEHDSASKYHTKKGKKASKNNKKVAGKRKNRIAKKAKKHSEEN
ncbi:unnamed protein product [Clonostachys rhizophaga]|uniref:Uncharacterized protein n=1 Tax=Clonostachys rhizophaga TaxID=160324 RepID=A0A9N9YRV0_9HYPO|nr:unnamed protein product [Clonostachys rhizophaga]